MKILAIVLYLFISNPVNWLGDFGKAQAEASATRKLILINFSGSDWCGPCIRLRKEILESAKFNDFAAENLILVRADFPRQKKNQPSRDQVKLNEALADKYNPEGKFPFTLLVDDKGKVLKEWDGYPDETPDQFIAQIKTIEKSGH
jgi:thioredoxin-related protein